MIRLSRKLTLAAFAASFIATQGWAHSRRLRRHPTVLGLRGNCPTTAGHPIIYTDPHGIQYTKPQIDSAYDQVCWQQDPPDTGSRDTWLSQPLPRQLRPS